MSEKDSLLVWSKINRGNVGDVVADHLRFEQPTARRGRPSPEIPIGQSAHTTCDADGANSLLTPQSEESPVADSLPTYSYQANVSSNKAAPNPKIAIPRDTNRYTPPTAGRVSRACTSCRARKVKCSGEQPTCRQCRELSLSCRWPMSWREEMKK